MRARDCEILHEHSIRRSYGLILQIELAEITLLLAPVAEQGLDVVDQPIELARPENQFRGHTLSYFLLE